MARRYGGAIAIRRVVDPDFSQFDYSFVIAEYGKVPSDGFGTVA